MSQEELFQQQFAMQALMELLSEPVADLQQTIRFGLTIATEALSMSDAAHCQISGESPEIKTTIGDTASESELNNVVNWVCQHMLNSNWRRNSDADAWVLTEELLEDIPSHWEQSIIAVPVSGRYMATGALIFWAQAKKTLIAESKGFAKFVGQWFQQLFLQNELNKTLNAAQAEIAQLAFYDSLTTLPNKRLLMDRLKQSLLQSQRDHSYGALLFIDLDDFKNLNETLGHQAGDKLLQTTAMRLTECLREADTVARMGGDEFVVMLDKLEKKSEIAITQIEAVGDKIIEALNQPYYINGQKYFNTPTLGATLFNGIADKADDVLKRADIAMYQAKNAGKNCLRFFDQHIQASLMQRTRLEEDLRMATLEKQFELYYQPQMDRAGHVTGAEALIRWHHPLRGFVSPMEFIPLAEDTGLITEIGFWVLETACHQLAIWSKSPVTSNLNLAVNVSLRQFQQPDFVMQVMQACQNAGANPSRLKLELTESMLANDLDDVITKMSLLRDHGVSFSLDDFGTGFSSLSFLKLLPLNQLKIDKSFVRDVLTDNNDAVIARTIVALAKSLGLNVIAEGVEYEGQREFLTQNGCYDYQGYLFSKPLRITDFDAFCLQNLGNLKTTLDVRVDDFRLN